MLWLALSTSETGIHRVGPARPASGPPAPAPAPARPCPARSGVARRGPASLGVAQLGSAFLCGAPLPCRFPHRFHAPARTGGAGKQRCNDPVLEGALPYFITTQDDDTSEKRH